MKFDFSIRRLSLTVFSALHAVAQFRVRASDSDVGISGSFFPKVTKGDDPRAEFFSVTLETTGPKGEIDKVHLYLDRPAMQLLAGATRQLLVDSIGVEADGDPINTPVTPYYAEAT